MSDRLYGDLRRSIITLALKPGDPISINTIASNLGISRSPVRDALLKLEKDALVDIMPQRGTCVSRIDSERMHEERFLRESLESPVIELFAQRVTAIELARLGERLARQKLCMETGDAIGFLDEDDAFHRIFFEGAEKLMCWDIIVSMSGHYRRVRNLILRNSGVMEALYAQHCEVLDALSAHNAEVSRSLIRCHLTRILAEEKDLVAEFPDYFVKRRQVYEIE